MENHVFKMELGGRELIVESGKYCGQADGSCIVRCGDTAVMVNATMADEPRDGIDFFPLSVEFEEKIYDNKEDIRTQTRKYLGIVLTMHLEKMQKLLFG